jgi:hypothetical protein
MMTNRAKLPMYSRDGDRAEKTALVGKSRRGGEPL